MKGPGLLLALCLAMLAASAAAAQPDCHSASSQGGLNACAADEYAKADTELNAVWKAVLTKYADRPVFLARLKAAQQAWIKFRDAEVDALYPVGKADNPSVTYGSVYPMCVSQARTQLTQQRIKQLKAWLDGVEEGDVCAGSIKKPADLK